MSKLYPAEATSEKPMYLVKSILPVKVSEPVVAPVPQLVARKLPPEELQVVAAEFVTELGVRPVWTVPLYAPAAAALA
jgi:nitrous oxide reductase accessory protein NosL